MDKTFNLRADDQSHPKKRLIDQGDGTHAELMIAQPPELLLTHGERPRIRVDTGNTAFFTGHEFRTFKEWIGATTATYVIKAVVPVDTILFELGLSLDAGAARVETIIGGTEGGTFGELLPVLPTNTMTEKPQPPYTPQVTLPAGGTLTGGTVIDVFHVKVSDNSNFAGSVGQNYGAPRGIAPGTYYFKVTLTAAIGVLRARWEERE